MKKQELNQLLLDAQASISPVIEFLYSEGQEEMAHELDTAWICMEDTRLSSARVLPDDEPEPRQAVFYTPAVSIPGELAHIQYEVADSYAKYHKTYVRNDKGFVLADYRL